MNMIGAVISFLILIVVACIFGTLTFPTQDEGILVITSTCLLIIALLYKKEKNLEEKKTIEEEKEKLLEEI